MQSKKKALVLTVCAALLSCVSVGSTLAYFSSIDALTNVFSAGEVAISLSESDTGKDGDGNPLTNTYVMELDSDSPIVKDPSVTVTAGSADCWVFVQLQESASPRLSYYLDYALASGWESLDGIPSVYWRQVSASDEASTFSVIANNVLTVKAGLGQEDMDNLKETGWPTLSVTAYAMQSAGFDDAAAAWAQLQTDMAAQG